MQLIPFEVVARKESYSFHVAEPQHFFINEIINVSMCIRFSHAAFERAKTNECFPFCWFETNFKQSTSKMHFQWWMAAAFYLLVELHNLTYFKVSTKSLIKWIRYAIVFCALKQFEWRTMRIEPFSMERKASK